MNNKTGTTLGLSLEQIKTVFNCVVRLEGGEPILFYFEGKELTCFNRSGGHSNACLSYMYTLPLLKDKAQAQAFVDYYNSIGDSVDTLFVLKQRLTKN